MDTGFFIIKSLRCSPAGQKPIIGPVFWSFCTLSLCIFVSQMENAQASTKSSVILTKSLRLLIIKGSLPSKVLSRHLIEALVMWFVEIPQCLHHLRVDGRVRPPFCLPQAVRFTAALRLLQAGEAFRFVEVEVLVRDDPLEAKKVLDFAQFSGRVGDEPLPADQVDLSPGEPGQPTLQVLGVQANPQWAPERIDLT